jgi:mono/diheme cytochrome c family protein
MTQRAAILFSLVLLAGCAAQSAETRAQPTATPGTRPNGDLAARGKYLATLGDCSGCHTAPGQPPFSGGLSIETPFGKLVSSNITPDAETGIGRWSDDQFVSAVQRGVAPNGHLYPAMPFVYYAHASRDDILAIRAYLKTVPPVRKAVHENTLPFPFNIRLLMVGWDLLFYKGGAFQPTAGKSDAWNRGAYIVRTLGHCGACHTPKNFLGGDKGHGLQGNTIQNWHADNLTADAHTGLGSWSAEDIAMFLKSGHNDRADAIGSMSEVVMDATHAFTDADLQAVATYLKDQPALADGGRTAKADPAAMTTGEALYRDNCTACHTQDGKGASGLFTPLAGSNAVQASDPTNLIRVVLQGVQSAGTETAPTGAAMPTFSWRLSDAQIADVLTYVRSSWGNVAPPVSGDDVAKLRKALH